MCFVKIYSNSLDSDLLRGSNLIQNPAKSFASWPKCVKGYVSKLLFTYVYTCISEWPPGIKTRISLIALGMNCMEFINTLYHIKCIFLY